MTVVELCFDDGPGVGLGHRRRMEALGAALVARGADVRMSVIGGRDRSYGDAQVVVVDSYRTRADGCPRADCRVVAIDDLDRDLAVDLVVRPSPAPPGPVRRARTLAGLEYALIDLSPVSGPPTGVDAGVVVSLGGADAAGLGADVATLIAAATGPGVVRHAPGPWSKASADPAVAVIEPTKDLVAELATAAVAVVAGGVTMLEALALGRPTVVVVTADNQTSAAGAVEDAGAAIVLHPGAPAASASQAASAAARSALDLLDDSRSRAVLAQRARALVDGRGADRVAEAILGL